MYILNKNSNRVNPLKRTTFFEQSLQERKHLQEWIASAPSILGEELLIIQKEFNGFNETNERLDLLALDKQGNLVIIENKLDDSGRDVVWQALKYASYCASLTNSQIVNIFQDYINKHKPEFTQNLDENIDKTPQASNYLSEFLEYININETVLNKRNSQRIILVAAEFRKEVTSTVLWLLDQGLDIQCVKVTPYKRAEDIFLDIRQLIPTPEEKEFRIIMKSKLLDEKNTEIAQQNSKDTRCFEYWRQLLEAIKNSSCPIFNKVNPSKRYWLSTSAGLSAVFYSFILGTKDIRVELYFSRSDEADNKFMYDYFFSHKDEIELAFGDIFSWQRLDNRKASRIEYTFEIDTTNRENWEQCIQWHIGNMMKLEKITKPILQAAFEELKRQKITPN